jgi:hypothetical protein
MGDIHTPFGILDAEQAKGLLGSCDHPLDDQILRFSYRWQLVGIFLRCTVCNQGQRASDSEFAFPHLEGCRVVTEGNRFPWRELAETLRRLPNTERANEANE